MLVMEPQSRAVSAAVDQVYSLQHQEEEQDVFEGQVQQQHDELPVQQQHQEQLDEQQQYQEEEEEQRVLQPLQPVLQLQPVQVVEVQHASAAVTWPQATYTLPDHENDDEQVAYQLQVHYKVAYTLQVQQVPLGPPTAEQSAEQLLSGVHSAVVESAWKEVLTLEEAPAEIQEVRGRALPVALLTAPAVAAAF